MPRATNNGGPREQGVGASVSAAVKAHPDYEEGYFAGLNDQFHRGDSPEYEAGYAAGGRARELFVRNGLSPSRNGFKIKFRQPTGGNS